MLIFNENEDWSFELLEKVYDAIEIIALEELKLDVYPNQIEIIDAERMLDAYSSMAMPIYYRHWSLGKSFISNQKSYQGGYQSLAYEVVVNTNPCISYLQESNNMTMQALVIAHAAFGHNAVFKNNQEFKKWTHADSILDELNFAKNFIADCESRYGVDEVEAVLDAAHALMDYGVDTFKRRKKPREEKSANYQQAKDFDNRLNDYNLVWEKTLGSKESPDGKRIIIAGQLEKPESNILYFIEKFAPQLPQWKAEIIRIVRKIAQYFYPQGLTKVLNEGFATFTHHYCMNRMYEKGLISEGAWFTFIQSHTNVIMQPDFNDPRYSGINPYALGFAIFRDIKRICENPTEEDLRFLPHLKGMHWLDAIKEAMYNNNDSSFIYQYLSPKVMKDFKLFELKDDEKSPEYLINSIHDEEGFERIRAVLSEKYTRASRLPQIEVIAADLDGDRSLTLQYTPYKGRPLDAEQLNLVLPYLESLWGFPVKLRGA